MKTFTLILMLSLSLFGEMGDCLSCHPKLASDIENDARHKPMKTCIKCHTKNESSVLECGDKCFKCHSKVDMDDENIPQHKVFEECRKCHVTKIHEIFNPTLEQDQSHQDLLKDVLTTF